MPPVTSNTSRSAPPANTGSALLDFISNASVRLVNVYSRFDPFIRPALLRQLHDLVVRLIVAGPYQIIHPGVHHHELLSAGVLSVENPGEQHTCAADQEPAGLHIDGEPGRLEQR